MLGGGSKAFGTQHNQNNTALCQAPTKQYLLDLTEAGYPVIPTVDTKADIGKLPDVPKYVIKPKDGADSIGLESCARLFTKCKKYFTNSQKISVQVCVFLCTVY